MSTVLVIGVDPGPVPGVVGLRIEDDGRIDNVDFVQINYDLVSPLLTVLARTTPHDRVLIGVERYVVGHRSSRSSSAGAGATTRDMVGVIERCGVELGAPVVQRTASQVKGWATDERLKAAGITIPGGMRHTKDAARHALFAACNAGHLPDPLSSAYKKPRLS